MRPLLVVTAFAAVAPGVAGCSSSSAGATPCGPVPMPDSGAVHVTGTVMSDNGSGQTPVPGAVVVVEYGGLYLPYCDLSHASPFYLFGAVADDAGAFALDVQGGKLGFHALATGQYYSRAPLDTSRGSSVSLILSPFGTQPKPSIVGAAFDATTVAAGASVTITATVAAGTPSDPLSDEVVLIESTHSWGVELDPPSLGKKDDFPDGAWSRTFSAPAESGTYTYSLAATSAGCVSSDTVQLPLVVH